MECEFHTDDATSFMEALLRLLRVIKIKRCSNCNAAVFVVLGIFTTSRKKMRRFEERAFWAVFLLLLLATGYIVLETFMG